MNWSQAKFFSWTDLSPARWAISAAMQYSNPLLTVSGLVPLDHPGFGSTTATVRTSGFWVLSLMLSGCPVTLQSPKAEASLDELEFAEPPQAVRARAPIVRATAARDCFFI